MEQQSQQAKGAANPTDGEQLPPDFANRVATKVVFTNERERDPEEAMEKTAEMLMRTLGKRSRVRYFADMLEILEDDPETSRYAGLSLVSMVMDRQDDARFEKFLDDFLDVMIDDHVHEVKPPVQLEYRRKHFSAYARILGESFVAMMNINNELYEVISHVYSLLIRKEMELEVASKERKDGTSRRISISGRKDDPSKLGKKLFDDVVDLVHSKGEQRSGTLQQQNPNEFVSILADRMRGTRRYVIQDILNKQALDRKKEAEKEISERLASAEEIILAKDAFKRGINLFWMEKQYNIKYMSVEKVRVTIQVSAVVVGVLHFLMGYLGLFGMLWWEGVSVTVAMYIFARFFGSRQYFQRFFPDDVTKELEVVVGSFTPTLRKMSRDQMDAFIRHQIRDPANLGHVTILPEFMKYIFAVMPERNSVVVQRDELADILQNSEMDIARVLRTASQVSHGLHTA